jgi:hypothetical protein
MSPVAALRLAEDKIKDLEKANAILTENARGIYSEMTGALQVINYLVKRFGTDGEVAAPLEELAKIDGFVRLIREPEHGTLTIVAVSVADVAAAAEKQEGSGNAHVEGDDAGTPPADRQ